MNGKKGFTLIEVLTVIVILGILFTIAVFAVSKIIQSSKEKAFIINAKTYINTVKHKVVLEEPKDTYSIYRINDLDIDNNLSSFGGEYLFGYVIVENINNKYEYYILLLDKHDNLLGTIKNNHLIPISEKDLDVGNFSTLVKSYLMSCVPLSECNYDPIIFTSTLRDYYKLGGTDKTIGDIMLHENEVINFVVNDDKSITTTNLGDVPINCPKYTAVNVLLGTEVLNSNPLVIEENGKLLEYKGNYAEVLLSGDDVNKYFHTMTGQTSFPSLIDPYTYYSVMVPTKKIFEQRLSNLKKTKIGDNITNIGLRALSIQDLNKYARYYEYDGEICPNNDCSKTTMSKENLKSIFQELIINTALGDRTEKGRDVGTWLTTEDYDLNKDGIDDNINTYKLCRSDLFIPATYSKNIISNKMEKCDYIDITGEFTKKYVGSGTGYIKYIVTVPIDKIESSGESCYGEN